MNVSLRVPRMTRDQFLDWAAQQDTPYEFDGFEPISITGGNRNHAALCSNLIFALRKRLDDTGASVLPEAGIATVGDAIRYPDVSITLTAGPGTDLLIPEPLVVFEVLSPSSIRIDHTVQLREYRAVPSIRRYVVVAGTGPHLTIYTRPAGQIDWIADALTAGEMLELPEIGIAVPVDEIFRGVGFDEASG